MYTAASPKVSSAGDAEKAEKDNHVQAMHVAEGENKRHVSIWSQIWRVLSDHGVEMRGIEPVPEQLRTDTAFNKIFTLWFTSLLCPLP
jgi:hypothetical protein